MLSDLRISCRQIAKSPGFTAIALITLALGIGVNTSMFSVLNALLLHQPPYPEPGTLVRIFRTSPFSNYGPHSPANFLDYRDQNKSFRQLAAFSGANFNLAEPGFPAERVRGFKVSGDFFALIGVPSALGRCLTRDDDHPGHDKVIVLSDTAWRRRFAADPAIVGRQIHLDGEVITVIGVMPPGFDDPLVWGPTDGWRPLAFPDDNRQNRGGNWLNVIGRLKPGVSSATARVEMSTLSAAFAAAYPATNAQSDVNFVPFVRSTQDNVARLLSLFAMGLAVCVLLIACANLANLLFARNALRNREHAIRTALGASRGQLVRQSLTESLLLALGGGGLGLLVAAWCNPLLGSQLRIAGQDGFSFALDWRVAGFALATAVAAAAGFGLLPALLAARVDVNDALKQGARGSSGLHHRVRHALIVTEVALALVLLSGAAFFIRGLDGFLNRDHGWRTANLLTANLSLPDKYGDAGAIAFYERLQARLTALPGVEQAALSRTLPFYGFGWGQRFVVEGQPAPKPGAEPQRDVNGVSPGYFDTMGITLLEGRTFTAADLNGPVRTVISESMAAKLWPGQSALGKRIAHPLEPNNWQEIIGVVRDIKFASNLDNTGERFQTYRLLAREPDNEISLVLRCAVPPETLVDAVRHAIAELDPDLPVNDLRPAVRVIEENLSNFAITGWLLSGFALLGLLLSAVGIYGVISGFVVQRRSEIGIRMALGAQVHDVLRLVLRQGLRLALFGTMIGLVGSWWVAHLLRSIVPALPAANAVTALGVAALLLAVAGFACWLPARRATKVDPMVALRAE